MEPSPKFDFDLLLAEFPNIVATIAVDDASPHAFAERGFAIAAPNESYSEEHMSFVNGRCDGELSVTHLPTMATQQQLGEHFHVFVLAICSAVTKRAISTTGDSQLGTRNPRDSSFCMHRQLTISRRGNAGQHRFLPCGQEIVC